MQDVITIGLRLLPLEQIAFAEPFDPASNPDFKSDRPFKTRVVLLNRDTVLAEMTVKQFTENYGFRLLEQDETAVNPAVAFRVETFVPTETFKPEKAYATRLKWRDAEGDEHSKLLLTSPEAVIAVALRGTTEARGGAQRALRSPTPRRASRKSALART